MAKEKLWSRIGRSFRALAADMERDSVSAAGPAHPACCNTPPEDLERRAQAYKEPARKRDKPGSEPA